MLVALLDLKSLKRLCGARMKQLGSAALVAALLPAAALAQGATAPKDAYLYFISPADGDTVKGAFWCRFGLRHMGVTHAGGNFPNSGHHHLLIDADEPTDPGEPIPQDKKHVHYGAGETEALIELPPGRHTLQLVLGDASHFNFDPPVISRKITVTVSGANADGSEERKRSHRHGHAIRRLHVRAWRTKSPKPAADAESVATNQSWFMDFIKGHFPGTSK
jgi:hypothetical protein